MFDLASGQAGDDGRRARARAATHAGGDEHEVGVAENLTDTRYLAEVIPAISYIRAGLSWSMKRSGSTIGRMRRPWSRAPSVASR